MYFKKNLMCVYACVHVCTCTHSHGCWDLSSSPCKSSVLSTAHLSRPLACMPSSAPVPWGSRAVTIMVKAQTGHQLLYQGCSGDKIFKPLGSISKSPSHSLKFLEKAAYALTETDVCCGHCSCLPALAGACGFQTWLGQGSWEHFFLTDVAFCVPCFQVTE